MQRVAALSTLPTSGAMANLYVEAPDNRLTNDIFLKLRLRLIVKDSPAAVALLWQRYWNFFIHTIGNRSPGAHSLSRPCVLALQDKPISLPLVASDGVGAACNTTNARSEAPFLCELMN